MKNTVNTVTLKDTLRFVGTAIPVGPSMVLMFILSLIFSGGSMTEAQSAEPSLAIPQVEYPEFPTNTTLLIEVVKKAKQGWLYGENTDLYTTDMVVVPTGDASGAEPFTMTLRSVTYNGGTYQIPNLKSYQNPSWNVTFSPTSGKLVNGLREISGEGNVRNTRVYFYSYQIDYGGGQKEWLTRLTWGDGAGANNPGVLLTRSQHPTKPGDPVNHGIKTQIALRNRIPTLTVVADEDGTYELQASTNLITWEAVEAVVTNVPSQRFARSGVWYSTRTVVPNPPSGGNGMRYFRYVKP